MSTVDGCLQLCTSKDWAAHCRRVCAVAIASLHGLLTSLCSLPGASFFVCFFLRCRARHKPESSATVSSLSHAPPAQAPGIGWKLTGQTDSNKHARTDARAHTQSQMRAYACACNPPASPAAQTQANARHKPRTKARVQRSSKRHAARVFDDSDSEGGLGLFKYS